MKTGLVSVSFRGHTPRQIVDAARACGLDGIEWGGDVHVPSGDLATAKEVRAMTADAGLQVFAYGSYYRLGKQEDVQSAFLPVLDTAKALGAPLIRLWLYDKGSADISPAEFDRLVQEALLLSDLAAGAGVMLSFECHNNTLTDEYHAALRFLQTVNRPNVTMLWQPNQYRDKAYNLAAARALAPFVTNLHVFHWVGDDHLPLDAGAADWRDYLSAFSAGEHALLLEFMHDGRIESLPDTARTLRGWLA